MSLSTLYGGVMPPKSDDDKRHTRIVRMSPALWERLRLAAFNLRRPQNSIIVEALEAWLDQHEKDAAP